jgi:hypothetical protein
MSISLSNLLKVDDTALFDQLPKVKQRFYDKVKEFIDDDNKREVILRASIPNDLSTFVITLSDKNQQVEILDIHLPFPWTFSQALWAAVTHFSDPLDRLPLSRDVAGPAPFGSFKDLPEFPADVSKVSSITDPLRDPSFSDDSDHKEAYGVSGAIVRFFKMVLHGQMTKVAIKFQLIEKDDLGGFEDPVSKDKKIPHALEFERFCYTDLVPAMAAEAPFFLPALGAFKVTKMATLETLLPHEYLDMARIMNVIVIVTRVFPRTHKLSEWITSQQFTRERAQTILKQIAAASIVKARHGVVHNDIHSNNIFVHQRRQRTAITLLLPQDEEVHIPETELWVMIYDWDRATKRSGLRDATQVLNTDLDGGALFCQHYGQCNAENFLDDWYQTLYDMHHQSNENPEIKLFLAEMLGPDLVNHAAASPYDDFEDKVGKLGCIGCVCLVTDADGTCKHLDLSGMITPMHFLQQFSVPSAEAGVSAASAGNTFDLR